ncbi:MAG: hypothetical protein VKI42_01100 [Synechococcaceae cyanobacterium]|nr:hypothetical protein [Synechococcaceae cyanobacterium]
MSGNNCDDAFQQIQDLQERNRQLEAALQRSERLRRGAGVFTSADVGQTFILPGRGGVPRELGQAEIQRGYQQLGAQMSSREVDQIVSRGMEIRARPMGADGRFTNYDRLLRELDIQTAEDYARLSEALGLTLQRQAPEDFAFITETYGTDRILDIAARAYADLGIPGDVLRARMASRAARFTGIVENKVWLRFWADRSKRNYLETLQQISDYMRELPGAPVPASLKQEAFKEFKLALVFERHNAYAKRRVAQALRSEQDWLGDLPMRLDLGDDQEGIADAIGMTARDIDIDSHFGRVVQAMDDGPAGQLQLDELISAAQVDSLDPTRTLDRDWFNSHMRLGNALVKDSQLTNLNTQLKPNLGSNFAMAFYGPTQETLRNGILLTPVGTRFSRDAFMESVGISARAHQFAWTNLRATIRSDLSRAFWDGAGLYGGNADTYGRHLLTNEQEIAELSQILAQPYFTGGNWAQTLLNPQNMALFRNKLQVAARILAFSKPMDQMEMNRLEAAWLALGLRGTSPSGSQRVRLPQIDTFVPWKPGLRAMGAVDEVFGKWQYLFKLRADLEVKARTEGAQLGLFDDQTRDAWVQARVDEAIYQATPTEANIKAFRKQHSMKGSDFTDDEIAAMIAERNLAGGPTLATPESADAYDYSAWTRFQNKPESSELGSWFGRPVERLDEAMMAARQSWSLDTIFPYWRSPFNALLFDHRLATFAAMDTAKLIFGPNPTPAQLARVQAAWVMSGATLAMFGVLDANGHITGGSEKDPSKRNSIFGIPYLGGIPVLNTMFLWKDIKEAAAEAQESRFDPDETLGALTQVLTNQLLRSTGLSTIHQLMEALTGDRNAWQSLVRYGGFIGAGQIPGIGVIRNAERATGTDAASLYTDGSATPGERYWLDQDSPFAKVERGLRDLAYNTLPSVAAALGAPRKLFDHLGTPLGHVWGIDLAKGFPFFPAQWPQGQINEVVYGELDTQDMLDPPLPLLTRKLAGIGMSDELQAEYNQIHGSIKGESLVGRMAMAGRSVQVRFPMPTEVVTTGGVRIRRDGGATIPLGPFLERHVRGKTKKEALYSLFTDPIYQAMEDDPLQSADPRVQDQPRALRRSRPAQQMIMAITEYYDLLAQDELERRAAAGTSAAAKQWSDAKTRMAEEIFRRSQETLDPSRGSSWLRRLVDAVNPAQ